MNRNLLAMLKLLCLAPEGGADGGGAPPAPAATPPAGTNEAGNTEQHETGGRDSVDEEPAYFSQFSSEKRSSDPYKGLKQYKKLDDLADALIDSRARLSKSLVIPTEKSSKEEVSAFAKALGIPTDAREYNLGEGVEENELTKQFRNMAIKSGLSGKQATAQWQFIQQLSNAGIAQMKAQRENQKQTFDARLAASMEKAYPDKSDRDKAISENMTLFKQFCADTNLGKKIMDSGLIYDPEFVIAIANHSRKHTGKIPAGDPASGGKSPGVMGNYSSSFEDFAGGRK